jgi:hypothetical protein
VSASGVIDLFATGTAATLTGMREAGYRRALDREPDGSAGIYYVEASGGSQGRPFWGEPGSTVRTLSVSVLVRYFRSADRRYTHQLAADDMRRIGDHCESPANYDTLTSGVRSVRYLGAQRTASLPTSELWEATFEVEWQRTA